MADESKSGALKISSREELRDWLESLPSEERGSAAIGIAARAALRVAPLVAAYNWRASDETRRDRFLKLTFATFVAAATARAAAQYPRRFKELRAFAASGVRDFTALLDPSDQISRNACEFAVLAARAISHAPASPRRPILAVSARHRSSWRRSPPMPQLEIMQTRAGAFITSAEASNVAGEAGAAVMWASTSHDADFIATGGTAQELAAQPLWSIGGRPDWAIDFWRRLIGTSSARRRLASLDRVVQPPP